MNARYFHFTLGPVQGFVSQARRTRDFWAGSFLLSWLSGIAMKAVEAQNGVIRFPVPDAKFMTAITEGASGRAGPHQGGIPNRFVADVGPGFDAQRVADAVRAAWRALGQEVYNADLKHAEAPNTRAIWDRQIAGFWEMSWAITDDERVTNLLDRRKNWRSHLPPDQPGLKCMMMDGWQELSGAAGPATQPARDFWQRVRATSGSMKTDLRPDEHLCAIAFVKRRFVRHFGGFSATLPGGQNIHGWQLPTGVPSVAYMAAAPWLAEALKAADDAALRRFHDAAYNLTESYGERETNIACVQKADGPQRWKALDGNVFFESALDNANLYEDRAQAQEVKRRLRALRESAKLGPVSPFYALLLMDGDSLGANMGDHKKQAAITKGLSAFTQAAPDIVHEHDGFLIYAGGDDVLALITLDQALACATKLRESYRKCFEGTAVVTSLSGAIEYAHIKTPLGKVLHDAHDLLDNIAKEGRGRDAIAVRVWKPGGKAVEWAMPWDIALENGRVAIEKLVEDFRGDQKTDDAGLFASKFFYRIRERIEMLNSSGRGRPKGGTGDVQPVLSEDQETTLLAAEYLNSGTAQTRDLHQAKELIRPLLTQCRPVRRDASQPNKQQWPRGAAEADAALLVRFLAHKGIER